MKLHPSVGFVKFLEEGPGSRSGFHRTSKGEPVVIAVLRLWLRGMKANAIRKGSPHLMADSHAFFLSKQHLLYFRPLPQGHGSLRPAFGMANKGSCGLRSRSTSEMFSGLSGSIPTMTFHPCLLQRSIISWDLSRVLTRATAGRLSFPNFAIRVHLPKVVSSSPHALPRWGEGSQFAHQETLLVQ